VSAKRAPLREATAVAAAVGGALELPQARDLLDGIVDAARVAFEAAACSVAQVEEPAGELVYLASSGEGSAEVVGLRLALGRGLAGYAAAAGETLAVDDVTRDPRFARDVAERTGYVPRSVLVAPITRGDDVLGVLSVLDRTRPPGAAALDLAARFARAASNALLLAATTRDLGTAVLRAAASATEAERPDVAATLTALAAEDHGLDAETLRLTTALAAVRRLGPAERTAAGKLLEEFLAYASSRRGRR
jgi:GAF domain-containing protein